MKNTGLHRHFCDISADYDAIAVDDILNIHKYLMKKWGKIIWVEQNKEYNDNIKCSDLLWEYVSLQRRLLVVKYYSHQIY